MRGAGYGLVALVLVSVLAGCLSSDDDAVVPPLDVDTILSEPLTAYLHDVSPLDETIKVVDAILEQVRVPAPDGVALDTWIVRPDTEEPVPIVMQVTPYYPGGSPFTESATTGERSHKLGRLAEELVPRGYAYVLSSVRGTGTSGGCFTQGGPDEAKDTAAVIEHLAAQPWSNGNVGLIGVSYPGTTPQDVWVEAPPSLKTIVPISGISDLYKYNFVNGVPISIQGLAFNAYYWWYVGLGGPLGGTSAQATGYVYDPLNAPEAIAGEACTEQIEVQEGGASSTADGNKDAYWQARDFGAELLASWDKNPERASVFYIHGLQDWNVKPHMMEDWLPLIQDTGVPYKIWLGQWTHNWPQREDWWNTTMVAWFDQFLKEIDTGILDAPPVQVQDDTGLWRHEARWPPLDVDHVRYHPRADGTLALEGPGQGEVTYHDGWGGAANTGTEAFGKERVVWESEPLTENMTLAGLPRFVANVTADGPRAALVLTLAERLPDGTDRAFNFAALSLNHAEDLSSGRPDITGETIPVDLAFFPQDDVVLAGSRIVLKASGNIEGGPGPALIPLTSGARITIGLDGAFLELPVDRTLVPEAPQPCWEGQKEVEAGERDDACYIVGNR